MEKPLVVIVAYLIYILLTGLVIWPMWNYVMPDVFGLPTIDYLQAVALAVIASAFWPKKHEIGGQE